MRPHRLALLPVLLGVPACAAEPTERPIVDDAIADLAGLDVEPGKADGQLPTCPGPALESGVPSFAGLSGSFRAEGSGLDEPITLTFSATVEHPDATGRMVGRWRGAVWIPFAVEGEFRAISDNLAVGAAFTFDLDGDGVHDTAHFVLGHRREGDDLTTLCLLGNRRPYLLRRVTP